jgi:steroid 5-alpha reductase family enzyme
VVSLPVIFVNGDDADPALDGRDYAGWTMWVVGFLLEVSSDVVKMNFRQNVRPQNWQVRLSIGLASSRAVIKSCASCFLPAAG